MGKMEGGGWSVCLQHQLSGVQNNTVHNKVEGGGPLRQFGKQVRVRVSLPTLEPLPHALSPYSCWLSPDPKTGLGVLWASTFYKK